MIKDAITNFLIITFKDDKLADITNFDSNKHLGKWLRIISPIHFSKEKV